ncbi:MAG: hypothetical protein AAF542_20595 [Pseudomonadota bacterium]
MRQNTSNSRVHIEQARKGMLHALVVCDHHIKERSDHAVRLHLLDLFKNLKEKLRGSGVVFYFDRLLVEQRAIVVTLPAAEWRLFEAFLGERQLRLSPIKKAKGILPTRTASQKIHHHMDAPLAGYAVNPDLSARF